MSDTDSDETSGHVLAVASKEPDNNSSDTQEAPFAPIKFGTREIKCLFDTGSEVNLLDSKSYQNLTQDYKLGKIRKYNQTLYSVNGQELKIEGKVELEICFMDKEHKLEFVILDEEETAIIGMGGMQAMELIIDTSKRLLKSNGKELPFKRKKMVISSVKEDKNNLFLIKDEIIPARKHKIVEAVIKGEKPKTTDCLVNLNYASKRYGLILPDQVVKTGETISIVIHNTLEYPVQLKGNATLGIALEITIDESEMITMASDEGNDEIPPDNHPLDKVNLEHLDENKKKKMEKLLSKHHQVFSRHKWDIGKCPIQSQPIKMKPDAKAVREPPRKYNAEQMEELTKQVKQMSEIGLIERSRSSFKSWPVLAHKISPTGQKIKYQRLCCDYRIRNSMMEDSDAYAGAVPRIVDIFDSLAKNIQEMGNDVWYAKLDITWAFFNVELPENDRQYFAFQTPYGLMQWTRNPFGSKQSPQAFATVLRQCLLGIEWQFVYAFLDDLLVIGGSFEQLIDNLDAVFTRLKSFGFKLKPEKVTLAAKEVPMLGYIISGNEIKVDPIKLRTCHLWERPSNTKEVLSFVQFCNFLRKFIINFAGIAKPLYDICRKTDKFVWSSEAEEAFKTLKEKICKAPVLHMPKFNQKFWLITDWSKISAAWALMQRNEDGKGPWKPILYGSSPMTRKQASLSSYAGELETVKLAIVDCKLYLEAAPKWELITDHQSLLHLMKQRHLSAYQLRIINMISELGNFEISHRKNTDPTIAFVDALSRAPMNYEQAGTWQELYQLHTDQPRRVNAVTRSQTKEQPLMNRQTEFWKAEQAKDPSIVSAKKWITDGVPEGKFKSNYQLERSLYHNREALHIKNGILYRKWMLSEDLDKDLIIISPKHLPQILVDCHEGASHPGITRTLALILTRYWTIGLNKEVELHIKTCEVCQLRKGKNVKTELERIHRSFFNERVHIDVKTLPEADGYVGYIVVVESFSRLVTLIPIENHTSTHMLSRIYKEYFLRWGIPERIVSDNEAGFVGEIANDMYNIFGVIKERNVPNRPLANGQAETFVKHSKNALASALLHDQSINGYKNKWPSRLREVEMALNAIPNTATGLSPFFIATGREFRLPSVLFNKIPEEQTTVPHSVRSLRSRLSNILEYVQTQTTEQFADSKTRWDEKANADEIPIGSKVLIRKYNLKNEIRTLAPKYREGIYVVVRRTGANYLLRQMDAKDGNKDFTVNRDQIKIFEETDKETERSKNRRQAMTEAQRRLGFLLEAEKNDAIIE